MAQFELTFDIAGTQTYIVEAENEEQAQELWGDYEPTETYVRIREFEAIKKL